MTSHRIFVRWNCSCNLVVGKFALVLLVGLIALPTLLNGNEFPLDEAFDLFVAEDSLQHIIVIYNFTESYVEETPKNHRIAVNKKFIDLPREFLNQWDLENIGSEMKKHVTNCVEALHDSNLFPESVLEFQTDNGDGDRDGDGKNESGNLVTTSISFSEGLPQIDLPVLIGYHDLIKYGSQLITRLYELPETDPNWSTADEELTNLLNNAIPDYLDRHASKLERVLFVTNFRLDKLEPKIRKLDVQFENNMQKLMKQDQANEEAAGLVKKLYEEYQEVKSGAEKEYSKYFELKAKNAHERQEL